MVSRQKGPTRHAYAWQIGPFWQDTIDMALSVGGWETNPIIPSTKICIWSTHYQFVTVSEW